jgi:hypothetical protein
MSVIEQAASLNALHMKASNSCKIQFTGHKGNEKR